MVMGVEEPAALIVEAAEVKAPLKKSPATNPLLAPADSVK